MCLIHNQDNILAYVMLFYIMKIKKRLSKNKIKLLSDVDLFVNFLNIERGLSLNTIQAYQNDIYDLIDHLDNQSPVIDKIHSWEDFDISHFKLFIDLMNSREYQTSTKSRKIASIKSFIKFLLLEKIIKKNPLKDVKQPSNNPKIPYTLSSNQIETLLEYSFKKSNDNEIRDNAMIELMYATGMRVSEIVNINLKDLDLYTGTIKVNGKGSKQRIIPLHEWSVKILENYINNIRPKLCKNNKHENAIFVSNRGKRMTRQNFWFQIKKIAYLAGINVKISPHTLRHSFATHLLSGGASIRHVQELLGHSNLETTQIYTHVGNIKLRNVYNSAHPRS